MNNFFLSLKIEPTWFFSSSYNFYNKENFLIGTIEYPLIAKMLNNNSAKLLFRNNNYLLVDAVASSSFGQVSKQNINTSIRKDNAKIVDLTYTSLDSNEEYKIEMAESQISCTIKLESFGVHNIYVNNEKIGFLENKEFILRRSYLYLNKPLPDLVQFLIFWGSINTQS